VTHPITINQRTAATVTQLVDRMQQAQDTLRTYVEAVGAALDVPAGWRFDVQTMAFVPPQEQREIPGLDPEFVRTHEGVFCGAPAGEMNDTESLPGEAQANEA
jgi:hypothetical protein